MAEVRFDSDMPDDTIGDEDVVPRPEWAYVGNHTFSIEWLETGDFQRATDRNDADGVTWDDRNLILIRVQPGAYESHYQEVLMHELTHAVWGAVKLTQMVADLPKDGLEENCILASAPGVLFLLKHNPHVVAYLTSDGTVQR